MGHANQTNLEVEQTGSRPFRVLLGITGSIAAYKAHEIIRALRLQGAEVQVVLTQGARELVSPLSLQALSGQPVRQTLWDPAAEHAMDHIQLARWPDLILIAPASAQILSKLAHGAADDLLTTLCLASRAPIWVAPAMNVMMWRHEATQANVRTLQSRGVRVVGPDVGSQACGDEGEGRMIDPLRVVSALQTFHDVQLKGCGGALKGKKMLITAGPTVEPLDPVRFLSNHSSGKMGYALAEAAQNMGADVVLVSGPTALLCPLDVRRINVQTAEEMYQAVMQQLDDTDLFIGAAAVADYTPTAPLPQKHKKSQGALPLSFRETQDILRTVAERSPNVLTIGFAAETNDLLHHAQEKRQQKKATLMIANRVGVDDEGRLIGFGADHHQVTMVSEKEVRAMGPCSKKALAVQIMAYVADPFFVKMGS